ALFTASKRIVIIVYQQIFIKYDTKNNLDHYTLNNLAKALSL
ncbi:MAG: hypothetical protein ACI9CQ_004091, partial [Saprospiraceae bacterium]